MPRTTVNKAHAIRSRYDLSNWRLRSVREKIEEETKSIRSVAINIGSNARVGVKSPRIERSLLSTTSQPASQPAGYEAPRGLWQAGWKLECGSQGLRTTVMEALAPPFNVGSRKQVRERKKEAENRYRILSWKKLKRVDPTVLPAIDTMMKD